MLIARSVADLRQALAPYHRPAFVPTMGNLHDGHIALVRQAKPLGDVTVASIFVNRLQFGPNADCAKLQAAGCDVLFAPREADLYPEPQTFKVHPDPLLADVLEGHFRPGFFVGVSTVVMKLFACVLGATGGTAVFGKKDYQQLMVIRNMVKQFAMPVNIVGGETQRSDDGLALSSRNGYLSPAERQQAVQLSATLKTVVQALRADPALDSAGISRLELQAMQTLSQFGWRPDYVAVRRQADLQSPHSGNPLVVLAAARLGATRLIDNLEV